MSASTPKRTFGEAAHKLGYWTPADPDGRGSGPQRGQPVEHFGLPIDRTVITGAQVAL